MKDSKNIVVSITLASSNTIFTYKIIDTTIQKISDELDKIMNSKGKYINFDHQLIFPKKQLVSFEIMTLDEYKKTGER